ncbi:MAG TPA: multicopper oxidase domain-containing protein [Candidatus Angelobacter sp.]
MSLIGSRYVLWLLVCALLVALLMPAVANAQAAPPTTCQRFTTAQVVALDQPFFLNRLGALEATGMIFALKRDVVPITGTVLSAGNVQLRPDKRPRPMVLRMNVGDCLTITFTNLLSPTRKDPDQVNTRNASIHVIGMQLVNNISDDGSFVGVNASSFAAPGQTVKYTLFAQHEGGYVMYSTDTVGGEGDGGQQSAGLFGAINVEPPGARWYRSQVTKNDLDFATTSRTTAGQPIINYEAVYPAGHPQAGQPVLNMLSGTEIVKSDLTAMITGPLTTAGQPGRFPANTFYKNPELPDREQPFREFTIIYHDEIGAVQAFPEFFDPANNPAPPNEGPIDPGLGFTLHSAVDGFAINYGTGGIGSEVIANRLKVGPQWACNECKYEENFLTSWAVGEPAMVVDIPANTRDAAGNVIPGPKATKALYPDDPSNVYHSYIADHTKFRILHGGVKEHHIHHQHAHQWVHTPNSDNSSYDDSQAIGPGAAFTLEMTYNGGGNRNQTAGDSIFHCHFYPHFAQGMWSLWRVHDVFEAGTQLDANGRPAAGSRAYPDGEIPVGTPIVALVPLPTKAMAPMPGPVSIVNGQVSLPATVTVNPGFPFFVTAVAGHRPPHPPLFTEFDGGLPRHIITSGTYNEAHTRLDFHKTLLTAKAFQVAEGGTPVEKVAMAYHAVRNHSSFTPDGTAANFVTNGLPAVAGAPFADPCISDTGTATGTPRLYQGADFQFDAKYNKAGWHFPQHRMGALWQDVLPTKNAQRPPQPLFFRANTGDCITFKLTNLMPGEYKQDDFQVRTPTDIVGQHIHLVKFDVISSDGAGNGWNYEEGAFSFDEVQERIKAIMAAGGGWTPIPGGPTTLAPKQHPFFTTIPEGLGAQIVVERWYADPTVNNAGQDRTLRTVFTHDHFGPSTHQQAGLYMGLLIEPQGSTWKDNETGALLGGRSDGGPTTWQAVITPPTTSLAYREFMIEFQDYALAYTANGVPINPPARDQIPLSQNTFLLQPAVQCPGSTPTLVIPPPCPEALSSADVGTMTVSYRNEPIALRVRDPLTNTQAAGTAGDLSWAYATIVRKDAALNVQPNFYPALTQGLDPKDPYTPMFRAYRGDKAQVRMLVGATEEGHNFTMHGTKWLREPSDPRSGWRNSQMMGISEHFELDLPPEVTPGTASTVDLLYKTSGSVDDQWNGAWGIARLYNAARTDLVVLPNNTSAGSATAITNLTSFSGPCPNTAPVKVADVTITTAAQALPGGTLVYNSRTTQVAPGLAGPLHDPTAIIYVRTSDLDVNGKLLPGTPIEPLVLRANPGDCLKTTLRNKLPSVVPDQPGYSTFPMIVNNFNANQVRPSSYAGLHPQLFEFDSRTNDGTQVGLNSTQIIAPGQTITYTWYVGHLRLSGSTLVATPVEYGVVNYLPSDIIKQGSKGAVAATVVEPAGSSFTWDANSRDSATITKADGTTFREFVLVLQNDVNMQFANGAPVPRLAAEDDPEDSGTAGFNYRTEPHWFRMGYPADTLLTTTKDFDFTKVLSNSQVGGDPQTPIFTAKAGTPVRFRLVEPVGHQRNNIFQIHGHVWEEEPYTTTAVPTGGCYSGVTILGTPVVCSTVIADQPLSTNVLLNNPFSEWQGSQMGVGPSSHFDILLINGAGGAFRVLGDYLYRTHQSFQFDKGVWGIFRVTP